MSAVGTSVKDSSGETASETALKMPYLSQPRNLVMEDVVVSRWVSEEGVFLIPQSRETEGG